MRTAGAGASGGRQRQVTRRSREALAYPSSRKRARGEGGGRGRRKRGPYQLAPADEPCASDAVQRAVRRLPGGCRVRELGPGGGVRLAEFIRRHEGLAVRTCHAQAGSALQVSLTRSRTKPSSSL